MTAVAIHPRMMIGRLAVYSPITDFFDTSTIITTMSGTATTPLITYAPALIWRDSQCQRFKRHKE